MTQPNLKEEIKLWKSGRKIVAGLDEAGRGPLAGPVVAAVVAIIILKHEARNSKQYLNSKFKCSKHVFGISDFSHCNLFRISNFARLQRCSNCGQGFRISDIKDSKQLSAKKRDELYEVLTKCEFISWGTGVVSEKIIDKINILEATKLAMAKAIANLNSKLQIPNPKQIHTPAGGTCSNPKSKIQNIKYLLLDGNFSLNIDIPQKSIIRGDQKVFSISVASIIAKVTRDRIMEKMNKKYPQYGFSKHKGYPTKYHREMIKKYGMCKIHRKTFSFS